MRRRYHGTGQPSGEEVRKLIAKVPSIELEEKKAKAMLLGMSYDVATKCYHDKTRWLDCETMEPVDRHERAMRRTEFIKNMRGA